MGVGEECVLSEAPHLGLCAASLWQQRADAPVHGDAFAGEGRCRAWLTQANSTASLGPTRHGSPLLSAQHLGKATSTQPGPHCWTITVRAPRPGHRWGSRMVSPKGSWTKGPGTGQCPPCLWRTRAHAEKGSWGGRTLVTSSFLLINISSERHHPVLPAREKSWGQD